MPARLCRLQTANKQKRITLKTVHEMLNGMSVELAEKVHLLFMANYIDYSDYDFGNENQVESYCWCYRDLFELKTKASQEIVNSQLIEFLDEWWQDAPSRYRKAKDDICYWISQSAWLMRWISTWKCSTLKPISSVTCTAAPASQTCSVMPMPNTGIIQS